MADHFTQFFCTFDVGSAENGVRAIALRQQLADKLDEDEGFDLGFEMEPDQDSGPGVLWISSDGYGEPEHVIAFVLSCAEAFDLTGRWGFAWSLTCPKPRLDGFGAGRSSSTLAPARASLGSTASTGCTARSIRSSMSTPASRDRRPSAAQRPSAQASPSAMMAMPGSPPPRSRRTEAHPQHARPPRPAGDCGLFCRRP